MRPEAQRKKGTSKVTQWVTAVWTWLCVSWPTVWYVSSFSPYLGLCACVNKTLAASVWLPGLLFTLWPVVYKIEGCCGAAGVGSPYRCHWNWPDVQAPAALTGRASHLCHWDPPNPRLIATLNISSTSGETSPSLFSSISRPPLMPEREISALCPASSWPWGSRWSLGSPDSQHPA